MHSRHSSIVILTGAGISAESGVDTFRDPDGIWSKVDYRDVATPEGFHRNPALVHDFYNRRRQGLSGKAPNAAHMALARLEREFAGDVLLVTQNIDHLHEAAGSRRLLHMHGRIDRAWCMNCGIRTPWPGDIDMTTPCPACHSTSHIRPDVVWFGEMPYHMDEIYSALAGCALFISIGTSGNVYPAAGFVAEARAAGAHTVELNFEPSEVISHFAEAVHGRATQIVPTYVERLLER